MFAQVYETCLRISPALTPPVVDDMELWQIAVVLGRAKAPEEPTANGALDVKSAAQTRYDSILTRRRGERVADTADRPSQVDPALATLIPSNAPERLR